MSEVRLRSPHAGRGPHKAPLTEFDVFFMIRPFREDVERYWSSVPESAIADTAEAWFEEEGGIELPEAPFAEQRTFLVDAFERRRAEKPPAPGSYWQRVCAQVKP